MLSRSPLTWSARFRWDRKYREPGIPEQDTASRIISRIFLAKRRVLGCACAIRAMVKARPISPTWLSVVDTMPRPFAWASLRACRLIRAIRPILYSKTGKRSAAAQPSANKFLASSILSCQACGRSVRRETCFLFTLHCIASALRKYEEIVNN